jgi:transcriptional regulator with GAF, ATPase, and Fis domain/Tfp pilus assembly protein PilF
MEVVLKVYRRKYIDYDPAAIDHVFSIFTGLRHQHIAPILEGGLTTSHDLWLTRQYIEIKSSHSPGLEHIRRLVATILCLNSAGYVHGGIKPTNVLLAESDLKLADPRIVNLRSEDSWDEIRFTAPEVLRGASPTPDSDLYSVGAVLYRWIVGQDAFDDSEMSLLKLKYLWASPQEGVRNNNISQHVAPIICRLICKDPGKRLSALRELADLLQIEKSPARRAPLIGHSAILARLRAVSSDIQKKTLHTIVLDGSPGIGKSRLVEQLCVSCSLDNLHIAVCRCEAPNRSSLQSIVGAVKRLINSHGSTSRLKQQLAGFPAAMAQCCEDGHAMPLAPRYSIERITSELVGIVATLARLKPTALVVEDLEGADSVLERFVEQLCLRAAEVPATLIITCRDTLRLPRLEGLLRDVLVGDFVHIHLKPLADEEIRKLWLPLASAKSDPGIAIKASGGNPLLVQEYAINDVIALSRPTRDLIGWMISSLTEQEKPIVEALSLSDGPMEAEIVSRISEQKIATVIGSIGRLVAIGIVEFTGNRLRLLPTAREAIYNSILPKRRADLSRRAFETLNASWQSPQDLARWSFEAKLFEESAALHRSIALQEYTSHNLESASWHYEQVERCAKQGARALTAEEIAKLARCYQVVGRIREARKLYEQLLASRALREDPELKSRVYALLAFVFDRRAPSTRIELLREAINSLPANSPSLCQRYVQLSHSFLYVGDFKSAAEALENAERHKVDGQNSERDLLVAKASLAVSKGNFHSALKDFTKVNRIGWDQVALLNNIGCCLEHLGELNHAKQVFAETERLSLESGHAPLQVLSRSNAGSIATKLGNTSAAQELIESAIARLQAFRTGQQEHDPNSFMSVYADAVSHHLQTGNFKQAHSYMRHLKPMRGSVLPIDRISCLLVSCEFYTKIHQRAALKTRLKLLDVDTVSENPFLMVAKNLIEVNLHRQSKEKVLNILREALAVTEKTKTMYQHCQVLNELARVLLDLNDRREVINFAKRALEIARRKGYRLLAARSLLLAGMASEVHAQKERYLYSAFQEASEMGLRELVAESAFEIGSFQLERKNWVTAQEYLMRCISVVEEIAEGVPERYRAGYMSVGPHRKALQALRVCNPEVQKLLCVSSNGPEFGAEKRYFAGLYQLTASGGSVTTAEDVIASIARALESTLSRSAVVVLRQGDRNISKVVKAKQGEELLSRADKLIGKIKDRIYLGASEGIPHKPFAWVPLECPGWDGGILVTCGPHESTFTEKEIEFLTMVGTIGSSGFSSVENRRRDDAQKLPAEFHGMIGRSKAITEIFSQIQVAAGNTATVLIEGESGTGKELVAKAIHLESARAKQAFIAVDCGAIPESLIEAELFGAKKGSYTGATSDRPGLFEAAHRGTIFLDEISNTTPALQAKLLRVIQEREVRRIGETAGRSVDVRLVVASNQNLESMVEGGRFRKDLLYRLMVLHIKMPPLRKRPDDIPILAQAFLQKLNAANKTKKYFDSEAVNRLSTFQFPGNVRELQNAIERAFFSTKGSSIQSVSVESQAESLPAGSEDVQLWFKDLSEGRKDFWSAVYSKYKRRDISREKVLALVDFGLRSTRGNYKTMAERLRLKNKDYRRFMDFLRRSDCLLDFRPYRKLAPAGEN